jgi:hypothetical protein
MDKIKLQVYKYITGIDFQIVDFGEANVLRFPSKRYGVRSKELLVDSNIFSKYAYKFDKITERSVLLFESLPEQEDDMLMDYQSIMACVLRELKDAGYRIFIKPHPRVGGSPFAKEYADCILSKSIPGEFISVENFLSVIGVDTLALANIARRSSRGKFFSLIKMFKFRHEESKTLFVDYLREHSEDNIIFTETIDELLHGLNKLQLNAHA